MQILANEFKRYITTHNKVKQSVSLVSGKLTTLGFFFVQNKDWFFFKEKLTLKHLKLVRSSNPRVHMTDYIIIIVTQISIRSHNLNTFRSMILIKIRESKYFSLISLFRYLFAHANMKPGVERCNFVSLFGTLEIKRKIDTCVLLLTWIQLHLPSTSNYF